MGVGARSQQQETSQMLLRLRSRASLLPTAEAAAAGLSSARLQYVTCNTLYIRLYHCELTGADAARKSKQSSYERCPAALRVGPASAVFPPGLSQLAYMQNSASS